MNCETRNIVTSIDSITSSLNQVIDNYHTWFFYVQFLPLKSLYGTPPVPVFSGDKLFGC